MFEGEFGMRLLKFDVLLAVASLYSTLSHNFVHTSSYSLRLSFYFFLIWLLVMWPESQNCGHQLRIFITNTCIIVECVCVCCASGSNYIHRMPHRTHRFWPISISINLMWVLVFHWNLTMSQHELCRFRLHYLCVCVCAYGSKSNLIQRMKSSRSKHMV